MVEHTPQTVEVGADVGPLPPAHQLGGQVINLSVQHRLAPVEDLIFGDPSLGVEQGASQSRVKDLYRGVERGVRLPKGRSRHEHQVSGLEIAGHARQVVDVLQPQQCLVDDPGRLGRGQSATPPEDVRKCFAVEVFQYKVAYSVVLASLEGAND